MLRRFVLWLRNWKIRNAANAAVDALRAPAAAAIQHTPIEEMESRTMLAGNGLAVTYFDNDNLTGKTVSRVDATVNFDWVGNSPASGIGADTFSARWTGTVVPTKSETYTFYTTSDDGVRLWVDGKQLVNNWTEHAPREDKGTITLQAGKAYDLKLEYNEKYYGAVMKLLWSSASTGKQVIPRSQLFSSSPAAPSTGTGSGHGLLATYYDNDNLTGASVSRTDATVNFDWVGGSPSSSIGVDTFSARWTGTVVPAKSETYTFYTQSDDGVRLWVDGKQLINNWSVHAPKEDRGTITLQAGKQYNIKAEYFEKQYGAVMKLLWSSAGTPKQVIPQSQLYPTAASTPVTPPASSGPTPVPSTGNGNGLLATYYDNNNFTGNAVSRTDARVDFNWGGGSPNSAIAADTFSARWTGQVLAQRTEEYTFFTQSDDGVRLWVNGQKLVDNWSVHAPTENSGKIRLEAGKKYDIKVEYYEQSAGAVMQLKWASASTAKQVVPQSQLFSTAAVTPPADSGPTPVPSEPGPSTGNTGTTNTHGLLATFFNNTNFTGNQISRYDANVSYDWGSATPHEVIGRDTWAARWQGQVVANRSEEHTFYITSDGGARLWVDGKLVINDWGDHGKREVSGKIYLTAGRHDVKLEYVLTSGQAVMQFRWSSPSIAKNFVPNSNLYAAAPPALNLPVPPVSAFTGYKTYTNSQVNFRPAGATDKSLTVDGYRISKMPINAKGLNIAVTDLVPGQKAFAYRNITIKNTEISDVYRTPGYHNDFIRIAGAAGRQDVLMNVTLENIKIHDGQAIPILITDGDYDTIVIRNVSITHCTVAQLQINTQNVGSVKRIIVENCPGLSVAITGKPGTVKEVFVRNSPGSGVADCLMSNGTRTGALMTILP